MNVKIARRRGKKYLSKVRLKAKDLRYAGLTHREIKGKLDISLGTVFSWTKGIILTAEQKKLMWARKNKRIWTKEKRLKQRKLARINLSRYWKQSYSDKTLLNNIREFYSTSGRIPLKREFGSLRVYRTYFGSWNNAIRAAGFEPNVVLFSKKFIAKDGHVCDSYAEKIIDDWLSRRQIRHEKNAPYKNTRMTSDFSLGNIRIEYFGLAGEKRSYDAITERKRKFCHEAKLKLIELYPSDLFSNHLSKLVNLKSPKV